MKIKISASLLLNFFRVTDINFLLLKILIYILTNSLDFGKW